MALGRAKGAGESDSVSGFCCSDSGQVEGVTVTLWPAWRWRSMAAFRAEAERAAGVSDRARAWPPRRPRATAAGSFGMRAETASVTPARGLLVFDLSYSWSQAQREGLEQAFLSRNVGGYFRNVVSAYPFANGRATAFAVGEDHIAVEGQPTVWGQWYFVGLLRDVLRFYSVSAVRVGDPYYLGILGYLFSRWLKVPLVFRIPFRYEALREQTGKAVMPRLLRYPWIERALERFICRRADLILAPTQDLRRYAIGCGAKPDNIAVIPYGPLLHPDHWIEPTDRQPMPDDTQPWLGGRRFVVTVSRLELRKRVADVVRIVPQLPEDVIAVIVGDGAERSELFRLAVCLTVAHRVIFAGSRSQAWLARVLPHASVAVSPHMGRALVECALAGLPMVAYDWDWQREFVDESVGALVPAGDVKAMAEQVNVILSKPELGKLLGANARARALERMHPDTICVEERRAYEAILAQ